MCSEAVRVGIQVFKKKFHTHTYIYIYIYIVEFLYYIPKKVLFFNDIVLTLIWEELKFESSLFIIITIELIIYQGYVNSHLRKKRGANGIIFLT